MEVLSNLTMNFIFVGFIVISLCIVCVFVLNYFYKNDYIEYYQWKSWKKAFIMMFLFIVSIILLFLHIDVLRKVLLIIIKIWKNNWKINILF